MFWEEMISDTMKDYFNRIGFTIDPWLKAKLTVHYLYDNNLKPKDIKNDLLEISSSGGHYISDQNRSLIYEDNEFITDLGEQVYEYLNGGEEALGEKYKYGDDFISRFHRIPHPFKFGDFLTIKKYPEFIYLVTNDRYNSHLGKFSDWEEDGIEAIQMGKGRYNIIDRPISPLMFDYSNNPYEILGAYHNDL